MQIPHLRRTCDELGVCQNYQPRCGICSDKARLSDGGNVNVISGLDALCDEIFYWAIVPMMILITFAFTAGFAGYLYARFFQ
jgi:hypothetical protein